MVHSNWGSGFLQTTYQGVQFRSVNPQGVDDPGQRDALDAIRSLKDSRLETTGDAEIQARINAFEMACRMQANAPELMDLSSEPKEALDLYRLAAA